MRLRKGRSTATLTLLSVRSNTKGWLKEVLKTKTESISSQVPKPFPSKTSYNMFFRAGKSSYNRGGLRKPRRNVYSAYPKVSKYFSKSTPNSKWNASATRGGFKNLGNSCYMNAILQALLGVEDFVSDLRAKMPNNVSKKSFYAAFLELDQQRALRQKGEACGPMDIKKLKDAIGSRYKQFAGHAQQDAHEFLSECLNQFDDDLIESLGLFKRHVSVGNVKRPENSNANAGSGEETLESGGNLSKECEKFDVEEKPVLVDLATDAKVDASSAAVPLVDSDAPWNCSACTLINPSEASSCSVCTTPRQTAVAPVSPPRGSEESSFADNNKLKSASAVAKNFHFQLNCSLTCTNPTCKHSRKVIEDYHDISLDLLDAKELSNGSGARVVQDLTKEPFVRASFGSSTQTPTKKMPTCDKCGKSCAKKYQKKSQRFFFVCQTCGKFKGWADAAKTPLNKSHPTTSKSALKPSPSFLSSQRLFDRKPSNLNSLLDKFFSPRIIDYKCEKCDGTQVSATSYFRTPPKALILHLKRFRPNFVRRTYEKRGDRVKVNETLDLARFLKERKDEEWPCKQCTFLNSSTENKCKVCHAEKAIKMLSQEELDIKKAIEASLVAEVGVSTSYTLQAVVHHQGKGASSGHYVTDVRQTNGAWKRFNDSRVTEVSKNEAAKKAETEGYILFYVQNAL